MNLKLLKDKFYDTKVKNCGNIKIETKKTEAIMFESIKEYIFKTLIVKGIISKLEKLLAKLPLNDAKTVTGLLIVCLGLVLQSLPQTAPFVEPILLALKSLPSEEIVAGGLLWSIVGMFHQLLKFIVKIGGFETEKEKVENKKIEKIVEKLKEEK